MKKAAIVIIIALGLAANVYLHIYPGPSEQQNSKTEDQQATPKNEFPRPDFVAAKGKITLLTMRYFDAGDNGTRIEWRPNRELTAQEVSALSMFTRKATWIKPDAIVDMPSWATLRIGNEEWFIFHNWLYSKASPHHRLELEEVGFEAVWGGGGRYGLYPEDIDMSEMIEWAENQ
ncbi:hypothetical protein OAU50_04360 [Planctomycetota bacterium]|nr:hypothetical protein [Planctomycetota bacterium]